MKIKIGDSVSVSRTEKSTVVDIELEISSQVFPANITITLQDKTGEKTKLKYFQFISLLTTACVFRHEVEAIFKI